ncbi:hypothetical protein CK203_008382 [Vitis vinifera]|uniref:Uncharacterized protein n=1 Tax=Vitis vinifera TaxID=29760 RepID=A0A438KNT1_VITVI|nr:hypothetical protein CK203_008382 [Vitis vinifera]
MVESLELHCKNEEFGCPEIIPYHTKLMHEDSYYHKAVMLYGCKFKLEFLIEDLYKYQSYKWDATPDRQPSRGQQLKLQPGDRWKWAEAYFEGIPRSIRESKRSSLESADNLIVLEGMAFSLGGETRMPMLRVTGRIWKA